MKKVFLSVFVALAVQFAYAGDHVIVVKDGSVTEGSGHFVTVTNYPVPNVSLQDFYC